MPCALKEVGPDEFQGTTGAQFAIAVEGDGAPRIVQAAYAGTSLTAPPWQFAIQPGSKSLSVLVATTPSAHTKIVEDCEARTVLDEWDFDPTGPTRFIEIVGSGDTGDTGGLDAAKAAHAKPARRGKGGRAAHLPIIAAILLCTSATARAQSYKYVYGNETDTAAQTCQSSHDFAACQKYLELTGTNPTKLVLLAATDGAKKFVQAAENARLDKQVGSNPASSGTTNLVLKGAASQLLGLAIEDGAVTETNSQAVTTLHVNALNLDRLVHGENPLSYCPALASCADNAASFLGGLSGSVSFNTTNDQAGSAPTGTGSNSAALSGAKQQVASWGIRYDFNSHKKLLAETVTKTMASVDAKNYFQELNDAVTPIRDKDYARYTSWRDDYAGQLAKAPDESAFRDVLSKAAQALIVLAKQSVPDFQTKMDQLVTTMATYFGQRDRAVDLLTDTVTWSLEYDDNRPADQPSQSTLTAIVGVRPNDRFQLTFNGAGTWYNSVPAQAAVERFRDAQASLQVDYSFTGSAAKLGVAGSAGFYYQYQADNALLTIPSGDLAPGTSITLPGSASVLLGTKGSIVIGQVGLTFSVPNTGIKLPFAISYANRTDLIKATDVRGHFGITYDLDSLLGGK